MDRFHDWGFRTPLLKGRVQIYGDDNVQLISSLVLLLMINDGVEDMVILMTSLSDADGEVDYDYDDDSGEVDDNGDDVRWL